MREFVAALTMLAVVACSSENSTKSKPDAATNGPAGTGGAPSKTVGATPGDSGQACPATGSWAQCSVLYRLDRAGLAPHLDSTAKVDEKSIGGLAGTTSFVVKIGKLARLEVFLYSDSAARVADATHLDRKQFVNATQEQTIKRERTLIENANLIGLLTSLNSHQRERASDALTAGPPQASSK